MKGEQVHFPQWWLDLDIPTRLRERIRASFTITRDGYARWYRGAPRPLAKSIPPAEVEDAWNAKRKAVDAALDAAEAVEAVEPVRTYRVALSEFLAVQKARIGAARHALQERTYFNYVEALNAFGAFVHEGTKVADMDVRTIGPAVFSGYARTFGTWKASGFDSVVSRVGALFRWAFEQEYIDRYRPGPEFVRPAKQELRDQRIDLVKSFTPTETAKLYVAGNATEKCWVALACCAAFNNADVANVTRTVVDLKTGTIDYRRRKTGKVRRVIPLPADVLELLRNYARPEPAAAEHQDLFFLSVNGLPYSRTKSRTGGYKPSDSISRLFARMIEDAGVEKVRGRNFSGLRTTFFNLCPRGEWELERKIIMGRAKGTVDLDSYLEDVGLDRLRHVTHHVWDLVKAEIDKLNIERRDAAASASPTTASAAAVPCAA